jgi:biotin-dependent carboxylase-like uncharacterized protein
VGRPIFEIINPGVFSTVQALNRTGYFASGIPPSGAMDRFALRMGNLLVLNPLDAAGIEMTATGMIIRFLDEVAFALAGGDFKAQLNGNRVPLWQTCHASTGDILSMSQAHVGWRGYLMVSGGIDVPEVLGSKSTYTLGGLGGYKGRILKKGDILEAGTPIDSAESILGRKVREDILPKPGSEKELRVVLGPQDDHVKEESIKTFLGSSYRVSINSNRVGYRFEGPQLFFKEREQSKDAGSDPSNIVDDGNAIGAIQIPAGKEPICLGPDGVTMGGYVKIACLIAADMDRMAQVRLQEEIRFKSVTVDEARAILIDSTKRVDEENIVSI